MLRLTALHIYPIKSAGGSSVPEWEVDSFGLRYDRRWMVVDRRGVSSPNAPTHTWRSSAQRSRATPCGSPRPACQHLNSRCSRGLP